MPVSSMLLPFGFIYSQVYETRNKIVDWYETTIDHQMLVYKTNGVSDL